MISFRYHIVSIVSVFLALAVGVALGGGPLKGEVDNTLVDQVQSDREIKTELQTEIASLQNANAFTDEFADTLAPGIVGGILRNRAVTIAALPTSSAAEVTDLVDMVTTAGGTVAGTVRIGADLLAVDNRQLVDELSSQLLEGAPDVEVVADASGYEQAGALLARAVATDADPAGAPVDGLSETILAGMSTAGLLSVDGELERRGSLVLVVAGPGGGDAEERQGANTIVTTLLGAVDGASDGVVLAGPVASAREDGVVAALRQDVVAARDVSSVDALGRSAARVVTVMALAGQARDRTGHYGAVDAADGAVPGVAAGVAAGE